MPPSAVRKELAPVAMFLSYNGTSGKKNPAFAVWKKGADKRYRLAKAAEKRIRKAATLAKQKARKEAQKAERIARTNVVVAGN
jgi:hypothetical protein